MYCEFTGKLFHSAFVLEWGWSFNICSKFAASFGKLHCTERFTTILFSLRGCIDENSEGITRETSFQNSINVEIFPPSTIRKFISASKRFLQLVHIINGFGQEEQRKIRAHGLEKFLWLWGVMHILIPFTCILFAISLRTSQIDKSEDIDVNIFAFFFVHPKFDNCMTST